MTPWSLLDWTLGERILTRLHLVDMNAVSPNMRQVLLRQVHRLYEVARSRAVRPPALSSTSDDTTARTPELGAKTRTTRA